MLKSWLKWRVPIVKEALAELLSVTLILGTAQAQTSLPRADALKLQLIETPTGSLVEVRLVDKQKLHGKLGAVTDAGFEVQTLCDGKIVTQTVALDQTKSIKLKAKSRGTSTAGWIVLGALAGVGGLVLILIVAAKSQCGAASPFRSGLTVERRHGGGITPHAGAGFCTGRWTGGALTVADVERDSVRESRIRAGSTCAGHGPVESNWRSWARGAPAAESPPICIRRGSPDRAAAVPLDAGVRARRGAGAAIRWRAPSGTDALSPSNMTSPARTSPPSPR